jgi:pyruvate dehydrogenase E1 component alpha subunit
MLHAVGLGWAERILGSDRVALTLFGDGATSEGDFHEAMNFAAVYATPTIFLCENNGWAISMSRASQTASETIAQKADAYGMPGVLVDGNDIFAVLSASREAVSRARAGDGPTLIEALTYRVGPHTTADDAGRYRSDDDVAGWRIKDPIDRLRGYLRQQDAWEESWERGVEEAASVGIEAAVERAEGLAPFPADGMFDRAYAQPTSALEDQRSRLGAGDE